ncbi:MAG: hypothetical protein ACREP6_13120 [Candidatus Binataceae bacterium]
MKRKAIIIAALLGAALYPALAMAAVPAEAGKPYGGGSWLALIFYVINATIFVWLCARYGGTYVRKFFGDRAHAIRDTVTRAKDALAEAEVHAAQATQQLEHLEAEKAQVLAGIEAETDYLVSQIRANARSTADRIRSDAKVTAAAAIESARRRIRHQMAAAAGRITRELVRRSFTDQDESRRISGFIEKLGEEARI